MEDDGVMLAVINAYNARACAATGADETVTHAFATDLQWRAASTGLDIAHEELVALAEAMADIMGETARANPDAVRVVLVDGLRQMFTLGAMHEQERARRDATSSPEPS